MIRFVTITGADDTVNPDQLVELSKEFPFVEWGILISEKQRGNQRFPSYPWIEALENAIDRNAETINLSLHVCGSYVREFFGTGIARFPGHVGIPMWKKFQRVQLNTHGEPHHFHMKPVFEFMEANHQKEFIIQLDEVNEIMFETLIGAGLKNVAGLFDKSHGAGISPNKWPSPYNSDYRFGYAGGLGPDNLADEIRNIRMALVAPTFDTPDFWVDMETKVRSYRIQPKTEDFFDIDKVRQALQIAAPWFNGLASKKPSALTVGQEMTRTGHSMNDIFNDADVSQPFRDIYPSPNSRPAEHLRDTHAPGGHDDLDD